MLSIASKIAEQLSVYIEGNINLEKILMSVDEKIEKYITSKIKEKSKDLSKEEILDIYNIVMDEKGLEELIAWYIFDSILKKHRDVTEDSIYDAVLLNLSEIIDHEVFSAISAYREISLEEPVEDLPKAEDRDEGADVVSPDRLPGAKVSADEDDEEDDEKDDDEDDEEDDDEEGTTTPAYKLPSYFRTKQFEASGLTLQDLIGQTSRDVLAEMSEERFMDAFLRSLTDKERTFFYILMDSKDIDTAKKKMPAYTPDEFYQIYDQLIVKIKKVR